MSNIQLTNDQKVLATAKVMKYRVVPPDIETFVNDDYYLGDIFGTKKSNGLYSYWMDVLKEIYPTPVICRYPYVSLGGAIGTGKSTTTKIMALYNLCKLWCTIDPWDSYGLSKVKAIAFTFIHMSSALAYKEFGASLDTIMEQSPYFKNPPVNHDIRFQYEGVRNTASLGTDSVFFSLSEINFYPRDVGKQKLDTAMGRYTSRFQKFKNYIGNIVFDCSARGDSSTMSAFLADNALGNSLLSISASQWEVKGSERGGFFKKGSFEVYAGDALHAPFIIKNKDLEISDSMDRDRVITVPMEFYAEFKSDIIKSLNDLAGITTMTTGKFLPDPSHFISCCKIPQSIPDLVEVDFYDKKDRLIDKLNDSINRIPKGAVLFIGIDIGVAKDKCGFAITYFDGYTTLDGGKTKEPKFITPVIVGISRIPGQETSIHHVYNLIKDLGERFDIGLISFDTYQSTQLRQDLTRDEFNIVNLSTDRSDAPYNILKNLSNRELIEFSKNERFIKEICNLKIVDAKKGKIDHPAVGSGPDDGSTSKDLSDAVALSLYNAYQNLDMAQNLSGTYKAKLQIAVLDSVYTNDNSSEIAIQGLINSTFG